MAKYIIPQDSIINGTSKKGQAYTKQRVLCHNDDGSVMPLEVMINQNRPAKQPGEYGIPASCIKAVPRPRVVGDRTYIENVLVVDDWFESMVPLRSAAPVKAAA